MERLWVAPKRGGRLPMGSVKTNLGHAEAAAGITGLIKAILCLRHRTIPPHLHWEKTPDDIDLDALGLRLPQTSEPWQEDAPYAAINSFGFGGANAHAIIGPPPVRRPRVTVRSRDLPAILLLSGPSHSHLSLQAKAYRDFIERMPDAAELHELAAATIYQRDHFPQRLAIVGSDRRELISALEEYSRRPESPEWAQGEASSDRAPGPAWAFAGMGPQWPAMGQGLAKCFPVYSRAFEECDAAFRQIAGFSIIAKLNTVARNDGPLPTELAQPLNLFFQIALSRLFLSWGIKPAAVVGHSIGEIAAFYCAGALDLQTALALVFHRSRLQARMAGHGGMIAVGADVATISPLLERHALCLAACNSKSMTTVAGRQRALTALKLELAQAGILCKALEVEVPYHSTLLAPLEIGIPGQRWTFVVSTRRDPALLDCHRSPSGGPSRPRLRGLLVAKHARPGALRPGGGGDGCAGRHGLSRDRRPPSIKRQST